MITRGGKRLAVLGPAPKATGRAVKDALLPYVDTLDDAFEGDVMAARDLLTLDDPWND
ncbi:prevent-host-death family protein [Streptomyces sp. NBC_00444]|uniref:prevent-host-death family protein n=1 Tax=Streptomyces sp. NBC_00444 TaxID=2975744 RepID=UPI002E1FDEDC